MAILVTGATGYIGSHTVVELLKNKYEVIAIDNFSNSSPTVLERINNISECEMNFYKGDVRDKDFLAGVFEKESIDGVIHFAAHKSVGESVREPLKYYHDNLLGLFNLCELMKVYEIKGLVYSSSATVYGEHNKPPFLEESPLNATNPYGETKVMIERILNDLSVSDPTWKIIALRYFNPVGAHPSGMIGEDPHGVPNNLMPYISQVAVGKREIVHVFGDQYDTTDGTGVRDYVHVQDLAIGHIKALEYLQGHKGFEAFNLGTNRGYSVLEVISAFERATGLEVPYQIDDARPGDVAISYADCTKAKEKLAWTSTKTIEEMCYDAWRWQVKNPEGYV